MQIQINLYDFKELVQLRDFFNGIGNIDANAIQVKSIIEKTEVNNAKHAEVEVKPVKSVKNNPIKAVEAETTTESNDTNADTNTDTNANTESIETRIRKVIQETRDRLGDNNSDGAFHKKVNNALRQISLSLGCDKPIAINKEEDFESFKASAKELVVENGEVVTLLPF